ncbi:MAG: outer membrane protein assembly factor BamB [Panacagrimonas sp.]
MKNLSFKVLLCLGLALVAAGCGNDKATVREPAPLQDITNPAVRPSTAWHAQAGEGSGGRVSGLRLSLQVDALYTADIDGTVFAYARDTGKLLWRTETKARIASGPSVSGDSVLVGTLDAEVIKLKRADGKEIWRRTMSSEILGPPVGEGEVIVARAVDGRVFGLSNAEGERVWSFDRAVPSLVLRGSSAPLLIGGNAIVGMDNGRVASLKLSDGQPQWEQAVAVPTGRTELERLTDVDADLLDGPDCVVAASFGGEVACLEMETGQILWRRSIRSYTGMAASADKLFITDDTGVLWGLDLRTGAAAWKQEALLYRRLSAPAFFEGHVVVGDLEGYLHWIDPSTGAVVARNRVGSDPIMTAPVAGEGKLYVINSVGRIAALTTSKPSQ